MTLRIPGREQRRRRRRAVQVLVALEVLAAERQRARSLRLR